MACVNRQGYSPNKKRRRTRAVPAVHERAQITSPCATGFDIQSWCFLETTYQWWNSRWEERCSFFLLRRIRAANLLGERTRRDLSTTFCWLIPGPVPVSSFFRKNHKIRTKTRFHWKMRLFSGNRYAGIPSQIACWPFAMSSKLIDAIPAITTKTCPYEKVTMANNKSQQQEQQIIISFFIILFAPNERFYHCRKRGVGNHGRIMR